MIARLHPTLRPLALEHLDLARRGGIDVLMTAGLRTPAEQLALYSRGRTWRGEWVVSDASQIVTHALPEQGPHCRGAAYDLCQIIHEKCAWERLDLFQRLGVMGESLGLTWGGRWKMRDYPHHELVGWRSLPFPPVLPPVAP